MRVVGNACEVVGLSGLLHGIRGKCGDKIYGIVHRVSQETIDIAGDCGSRLFLGIDILSLEIICPDRCLGEPNLIFVFCLYLALERVDCYITVKRTGTVSIVVLVGTVYLIHRISEHILLTIVAAAEHICRGHCLASFKILVPSPLSGNVAKTGSLPCIHIDCHIVADTAAGDSENLAIVSIGIGAPVGNEVNILFRKTVSDIHIQAVFPAEVGICKSEFAKLCGSWIYTGNR